ncbi:MAG: hypothetical protein ABI743_13450, partial [bacterium]
MSLVLLLGLAPASTVWAQNGDEDDQGSDDDSTQTTADDEGDETASDEEPADEAGAGEEPADDTFYADGIDEEPGGDVSPDAPYLWGIRGNDGSWDALVYDIMTDQLPPETFYNPWDVPSVEDDEGAPTTESIQDKLQDENFSPLKQVLTEGPVDGAQIPLMVLISDAALDQGLETKGIPDTATYKAVTLADQLTNGIGFTYDKRSDAVTLSSQPQNLAAQLQYLDAKAYDGVVQFFFNLGMPESTYLGKTNGKPVSGQAIIASESIADGYDQAREQALEQAIKRAIGERYRGQSTPLPDTITGTVDFFQVTNEGYLDGSFTVELDAWVTV